jgi:ubiquitin-protein ligase
MNARLRRLYADSQKIQDEFTGHPYIQVRALAGNPPEAYEIDYRVTGLKLDRTTNRPVRITEHRARIYLHQDYPREKPRCEMLTEIFHPNFGSYICIGDYWSAGETIADIIIQIGEMIQYKEYNPKSPLDALAARWSEQNRGLLPVGHVDLYQPEVAIDFLDTGGGAGSPGPRPGPPGATRPAGSGSATPRPPAARPAPPRGGDDVDIDLG